MKEKEIKKLVSCALEDYDYLDLMDYFLTENSFKEKANEKYNENILLCEYVVARSYKSYLKTKDKEGIIYSSLNAMAENYLEKKDKKLKFIRR